MVRAKVLKHLGDFEGAAEAADHGRAMDKGDRFINTVAVKHLIRSGRIDQANKTAELFLRENDTVGGRQGTRMDDGRK